MHKDDFKTRPVTPEYAVGWDLIFRKASKVTNSDTFVALAAKSDAIDTANSARGRS